MRSKKKRREHRHIRREWKMLIVEREKEGISQYSKKGEKKNTYRMQKERKRKGGETIQEDQTVESRWERLSITESVKGERGVKIVQQREKKT